ncbi:MAG: HAMP domain-containing protein [Pontibacterium sp.]
MKSIKTKIIRAMVLVAILPVVLLGGYVYFATQNALQSSAEQNLQRQAELISGSASEVLAHVPGDLAFLRDSASMFEYGRALVIKDKNLLDKNSRSLARDFLSLAKNRRIYNQLRFIDAKGHELIRVEHNEEEGFSRVLQPEQLRDKSLSPYFQEATKLQFGQTYISPIDLNKEDGELETPVRPTIRFATPIFAVGSRLVGVLILNVDANAFLKQIRSASVASGIEFDVIDERGYFMANLDRSVEWGAPSNLNHGTTLATKRPELAAVIDQQLAATMDVGDYLVIVQPLYADAVHQNTMGRLVAIAPKSVVLSLLNTFTYTTAGFIVFAVILAVVLAGGVGASLTRPLAYLTRAADNLSKGDVETPIEVQSGDEMQTLAEAFERLRESIKIMMRL